MGVNVLHELPPVLHSLQGNTETRDPLRDSHTGGTNRIKANTDLQINLFSNLLQNISWNKARSWSTPPHTPDLDLLILNTKGKNGYRMTLKMTNQWSLTLYPKPLLLCSSSFPEASHSSSFPTPISSKVPCKQQKEIIKMTKMWTSLSLNQPHICWAFISQRNHSVLWPRFGPGTPVTGSKAGQSKN